MEVPLTSMMPPVERILQVAIRLHETSEPIQTLFTHSAKMVNATRFKVTDADKLAAIAAFAGCMPTPFPDEPDAFCERDPEVIAYALALALWQAQARN